MPVRIGECSNCHRLVDLDKESLIPVSDGAIKVCQVCEAQAKRDIEKLDGVSYPDIYKGGEQ